MSDGPAGIVASGVVLVPEPDDMVGLGRSLAGRLSSSARATRTALGTARLPVSTPSEISGTSVRERPKEMPTPGYVVRPSDARASYRPPPPTDFSRS